MRPKGFFDSFPVPDFLFPGYFFGAKSSFRPSWRISTTEGSARVEMSPKSVSSRAIFRRTRRMILPLRVFGRFAAS